MKQIKPHLPDVKLVTIGSLPDAVEAELVKNTLIEHEIDCQLDGTSQCGFTGILSIGIMVCEQDAAKARAIMELHFPQLFGPGQA
jgi:hypothetical protein